MKEVKINFLNKEIKFIVKDEEDYIQKHILSTSKFYEEDMLLDMLERNKDGIILDIGANIGNHTLFLGAYTGKNIIAFEPFIDNFELLKDNVSINNLSNVEIKNYALGAFKSKGIVKIPEKNNLGMCKIESNESGNVKIKTLDSLKLDKIGAIKIDVEGMEMDVLIGAKKTILKYQPNIYVEAHNPEKRKKVEWFLNNLGYVCIDNFNKTPTYLFIPIGADEASFSSTNRVLREISKDMEYQKRRSNLLLDYDKRLEKEIISLKEHEILIKNEISKNIDKQILEIIESNNIMIDEIKSKNNDEILNKIFDSIDKKRIKSDTNKLIKLFLKSMKKQTLLVSDKIENNELNIKKHIDENKSEIIKSFESSIQSKSEKIVNAINSNKDLENRLIDLNKKQENEINNLKNSLNQYKSNQNKLLKKINTMYNFKTFKLSSWFRKMFGMKTTNYNSFEKEFLKTNEVKENFKNSYDSFKKDLVKEILKKPFKSEDTSFKRISFAEMDKKEVFVGIAAIPEREKALEETIKSLINQVDRIGVYLNNWDHPILPAYLNHKKIEIMTSQKNGDYGDAGKFYWVDNFKGYYFTCDDDIVYPKDYISRTISAIKKYNNKAVIGFHGSIIKDDFETYYDPKYRQVLSFATERANDTPVHILGTGTIGFNTDTIKVSFADFLEPNMADIWFAKLGQEQEVAFIVQKHKKGEMISIESVQDTSINKDSKNNLKSVKNTKQLQDDIVKSIKWKINRFDKDKNNNSKKLNIILVGRFSSFEKGGIYKSNHLIKNILIECGHNVKFIDSMDENEIEYSGFDVCMFYPGDPNRPDYNQGLIKVNKIRNFGTPILANLSYNNNKNRSKEIVEIIKTLNQDTNLGKVYLMSFTNELYNDIDLDSIKDFIIPFPKTISGNTISIEAEREGIVLGDYAKLTNPDITGVNAQEWIDEIKKLNPNEKLYVFKQYSGDADLKGVESVPYMKEDFLDWVSKRKLFVCLNEFTTFEMAPTEAQSVGTPVLYRNMKQSLNEYIGLSGIMSNNKEDFAKSCQILLTDNNMWKKYSELSKLNFNRNNIDNLKVALEFSFKRIIN